MEHRLISDILAEDFFPKFAWLSDVAGFFERPAVVVVIGIACVAVSLRITRNARHTLAGVAMLAVSLALPALAAFVAPPLGIILLPIAAVGAFQALHWASARRDRLRWVWQAIPAPAWSLLSNGTALATAGFLVMWGTTALAVMMRRPGATDLGFTPIPIDWFWALVGMAGLLAAAVMLIVGGVSMLRGFRAMAKDAASTMTSPPIKGA
ncbi:hypothetical protein [Xanthomonas axonopodis]|uniref:hypothetical protein n=1 Tax=Xanthomonas axonopodis TaxID=53413 RepID=UPI00355843A1